MGKFEKQAGFVVARANIILLVLDARMPFETRNEMIEKRCREEGKVLIYVISKSDLVPKKSLDGLGRQFTPSVFVSSTEKTGMGKLRSKIMIEASKAGLQGVFYVGVLGYPNVGKSSLINAFSTRKAAPVSNISGTTRSLRTIKGKGKIMLIDTPGVIARGDKDDVKKAIIGTIDFTKAADPEAVVSKIMETYPGKVEKFYGVSPQEDNEALIDVIALKKRVLKKAGMPDTSRMARMILQDWQNGFIR